MACLQKLPLEILSIISNFLENLDYLSYLNFSLTCKSVYIACSRSTVNGSEYTIGTIVDMDAERCNISNLGIIELVMHNVKYLDCSTNSITKLPDNLDSLKYLNCSENRITKLPDKLDCLKYLNCTYNPLANQFINAPELEYLNCSHLHGNKYWNVGDRNVWLTVEFPKLKYLNCSKSCLTIIGLEDSEEIEKMICIDSTINVGSVVHTPYLDCSYSSIDFISFIYLQYLNCTQCNIVYFDGNHFPLLKTLICKMNYTMRTFINVAHIVELDCSYCRLDSLPYMPNIKTLNCSYNFLETDPVFSHY